MSDSEDDHSAKSGSDEDASDQSSQISGVPDDMRDVMRQIEREPDDEPDDLPKASDKRSRKAKHLLIEFAQLSTTHGISHMGEAHTKGVMIFWTLMLCLCAVGFLYLFGSTLMRFVLFETNVEITMESKERYFPAVTICNLCPFKKEPLMKVPELAALVYAFAFGISDQEASELQTWPYKPDECKNNAESYPELYDACFKVYA